MTARTISLGNAGRPLALVTAIVAAAVAIAVIAVVATAPAADLGTEKEAPAIGPMDDFGMRHGKLQLAAPGLTTADDHATRHAVPAPALTTADDYATRHGGTSTRVVLTEADDYGTRGSAPISFGPPGR